MVAFSSSAFIFIVIVCIVIGFLPFSNKYKEAKKLDIIKAFVIWLIVLFCYIKIELTENTILYYPFGWILNFILIIMTVKETLYGLIISKKIKAGKELSSISSDDIPVAVRIIFEPFAEDSAPKKDTQKFKDKFKKLFPSMFLCIYMFFMFGVYEPYFANVQEWKFDFWDLLIPSLAIFVAGMVLTILISKFSNKHTSDIISIFLVVVCMLAYLQSNFFNQKTFLDGSPLEITKEESLLNLILWIVIGSIPVFCYRIWKNKIVKVAVYLSFLLLFMQIAPLPFMLINGISLMNDSNYDSYFLSGDKQFEVSSEENVIVFIMDTYYVGYFNDYIKKNPESCSSFLSDFTFFDNVTTETTYTAFSMPCLLTQHDSDYSISLIDSNAAGWVSSEATDFYKKMHNQGYKVRLYTDNDRYSGDADNMIGKIDNVVKCHSEYITDKIPTYLSMLKLSMYRYCPEFMKSTFYIADSIEINKHTKSTNPVDNLDLSDWNTVSNTSKDFGICYLNADYYKSLAEGLTPVSDEKLCIFQHIYGMHDPFMGIENNNALISINSSDIAVNSCMTILEEYIEQLKKIGVYDNSTIILTADHGMHENLNQSQPIMLIKPAGTTKNSMTINTAPGVLQDDLLPTILDCIGMESDSSAGYSLLRLDEDMQRSRIIRSFGISSDFKPAKKCSGVGEAQYNSYTEYTFSGRIDDVDFSALEGVTNSITDYWW